MATLSKFVGFIMICCMVASVTAAPVINPSVQTRPIICRYWLTSWLCSETGGSGGGQYTVTMDSSTESTVNIWNFTSDLMNWTSTTTNIYEGGMNQTPNMTAGPPGEAGTPGENGLDATVAVNYTFTLDAGEDAMVVNVGTPSAVELDFGIPKGDQGDQGDPGAPGAPGDAATIDINYTFVGTPASVTNVGTTSAALLDFVIPPGEKGDTGEIPDTSEFLFRNGSRSMTGNLNLSSNSLVEVLYTDQLEAAVPGTPAANTIRLYVEEVKGFSFFSFKDDTGMVRKLVRDSVIVAKNVRGTTIPAYRAVYATGSQDQVPTIDLAKADNMTTMPAIGITIESIMNGSYGRVMQVGLLEDINTDGFQEGDVIFVSDITAGMATNISPVWPNVRQELGTVLVSNTTVGAFQVVARSTINDGWASHSGLLNLTDGDPHTQYILESNTSVALNPQYGYLTLMAGSGMVTTTNPGTMNQWETGTNKNNFIYFNFTDTGTETVQWIVNFPNDWNSSANVWFTPLWTAQEGSGTVHWDISGKLFPDDAALDTALAAIGDSTDTLLAVGDMHVAPDTTGAVIGSVGSGGNLAIVKVVRSSADDTLNGTAQLLGVRVKFSVIKGAA